MRRICDAETKTRRSKQRLETFGRDVRAVTAYFNCIMCRHTLVSLYPCCHDRCVNRPYNEWNTTLQIWL